MNEREHEIDPRRDVGADEPDDALTARLRADAERFDPRPSAGALDRLRGELRDAPTPAWVAVPSACNLGRVSPRAPGGSARPTSSSSRTVPASRGVIPGRDCTHSVRPLRRAGRPSRRALARVVAIAAGVLALVLVARFLGSGVHWAGVPSDPMPGAISDDSQLTANAGSEGARSLQRLLGGGPGRHLQALGPALDRRFGATLDATFGREMAALRADAGRAAGTVLGEALAPWIQLGRQLH